MTASEKVHKNRIDVSVRNIYTQQSPNGQKESDMVKRAKIANVGEADIDPENELESSFVPNEDGDAANSESDAGNGDTEQDVADQQAAGVRPQNGGNKAPPEMATRSKKSVFGDVIKLGTAYGAGKVSMIALAQTVVEAAEWNTISDGDAEDVYDRFRAGSKKAETIDGDDGSLTVPDEAILENAPDITPDKSRTAQVSKLRTLIKLGNKFTNDASDLVRRTRNLHIELLGSDRGALKPGSTYTVIIGIASKQMDAQKKAVDEAKKKGQKFEGNVDVFSDEELRGLLTSEVKPDAEKDGADKIIEAIKVIRSAQNGNEKAGRPPVFSAHLDEAIDSLKAALVDAEGGPENGQEKLDEYERALADAEQKRADAVAAKAEAEAAKAAKALEPKAPKQSKADRQANLKTAPAAA